MSIMSAKKDNVSVLEKTAKDIVFSNVQEAISDLASKAVTTAIEGVKSNIGQNHFRMRLTGLKERKSSSEDSSV
jgi:hypothetical protein